MAQASRDARCTRPPSGEIEALAREHGLAVLRILEEADGLGRSNVAWTIVVLRLPDDGSLGLPLVRGIVLNDDRSSTYKLGLLRAVAKIADTASSLMGPVPEVVRGEPFTKLK